MVKRLPDVERALVPITIHQHNSQDELISLVKPVKYLVTRNRGRRLSLRPALHLDMSYSQNVSLHINNAFAEGELEQDSVVKEYLTTAADGKNYRTRHYSLDVIISVGYRVKSLRGTQFRRWALEVLKEYLKKGFAMNDDLLKKAGGGNYWQELLERIRDIRSSEKVFLPAGARPLRYKRRL